MILDLGAPCSLFGRDWMKKWLKENGMNKNDLENVECNKSFALVIVVYMFQK